MELLIVLLIPVMSLGVGYIYGRNTEPPLVDPDLYVEPLKE